jgi:hypothetical protein
MTIDELRAMLNDAKKELRGGAEVVLRDDGSDHLGAVRIERISATTAVIYDLGNSGCAWTLDEYMRGTNFRCLRLD